MAIHLLSLREVHAAKNRSSTYTLRDGGSLYLYVTPAGNKLWRYRYRLGGTSYVYSIGKFPEVSLDDARQERSWAQQLVKQGMHPLAQKKSRLLLQIAQSQQTFARVAQSWLQNNSDWSSSYKAQVTAYLQRDILPVIGQLPINSISVAHLRTLISAVAERGPHAALAVRLWLSQVFCYGAQHGLCDQDPAALLRRFIKPPATRHNPSLSWQEIAAFDRALTQWEHGHELTRMALRLLALTFVRTIELRRATWDQIDFKNALWSIPAQNMKMRRPHLVPLSTQSLQLLQQLQQKTGQQPYLFPNARQPERMMGSTTLNHAINALGFQGRFSAHGFRSTATTLFGLLSYPENRVDLQLAHRKRDGSRAPYDHTKYVSSRRILMQDWADIWDALAQGASMQYITHEFGPLSSRREQLLRVTEREH